VGVYNISMVQRNWVRALELSGINVPDNKKEFNISCPFHAHDDHPSLSINAEKGVWICHAGCGKGTIRDFLLNI